MLALIGHSSEKDLRTYVPVKSACELSGYNQQYLRRLLRTEKLDGIKVGQVWLIESVSLENHLSLCNQAQDRRRGPQIQKKRNAIKHRGRDWRTSSLHGFKRSKWEYPDPFDGVLMRSTWHGLGPDGWLIRHCTRCPSALWEIPEEALASLRQGFTLLSMDLFLHSLLESKILSSRLCSHNPSVKQFLPNRAKSQTNFPIRKFNLGREGLHIQPDEILIQLFLLCFVAMLHCYRYISLLLASFRVSVSISNPLQWVAFIDYWFDFPCFDQLLEEEQIFFLLAGCFNS